MVFLFSKILQCTPGRDTKTTVLSGDAIVFEILKHQRQKVDTFLIHDALSSIMESWNAWNITNTICNKRNRHVKFTELEDKSQTSQKCAEKPGAEFGLGGLLHAIPFFPEESEEMAPERYWKRKQKS